MQIEASREHSELQQPNSTKNFSNGTSEAIQNTHQDKSLADEVSTTSLAEDMIQKEELNDESLKDHVSNIWSIISY